MVRVRLDNMARNGRRAAKMKVACAVLGQVKLLTPWAQSHRHCAAIDWSVPRGTLSRVFTKNTDYIVVSFLFVLVFLCVCCFLCFLLLLSICAPPPWFLTLWKVKGEGPKNGQNSIWCKTGHHQICRDFRFLRRSPCGSRAGCSVWRWPHPPEHSLPRHPQEPEPKATCTNDLGNLNSV